MVQFMNIIREVHGSIPPRVCCRVRDISPTSEYIHRSLLLLVRCGLTRNQTQILFLVYHAVDILDRVLANAALAVDVVEIHRTSSQSAISRYPTLLHSDYHHSNIITLYYTTSNTITGGRCLDWTTILDCCCCCVELVVSRMVGLDIPIQDTVGQRLKDVPCRLGRDCCSC